VQTYYPTAYNPKLVKVETIKGSVLTLAVDWAEMADELEAVVTAAEWHTGNPIVATLASDTLTGSIASVNATAAADGTAVIECWAQFDDGQLRKQQFEFTSCQTVVH
jgi:hypothetical protein